MAYALNGIKNLLQLINDNWALLVAIAGLGIGLYKKISVYFNKTSEQRIKIAKDQIHQRILEMITNAEFDYAEYVKAGEIKRSQVISKIYDKYPILNTIHDQNELIQWIDDEIKDALKTLRKIIEENKEREAA